MGQQSSRITKLRQLALLVVSPCLIAIGGLTSCQASMAREAKQSAGAVDASVCEIVTHKNSYIGRTVRITALWKTDNLHYGYFEDPESKSEKCKAQDLIQLGYISKMHDESVVRFFDAGRMLCKAKNQIGTCVQAANVQFVAKIMSDKDGLYVHLDRVLSYEFLE